MNTVESLLNTLKNLESNQPKYFDWISRKMETLNGSPVPASDIFKDNISYNFCKANYMSVPEFHLVYVVDCAVNERTGRKKADAIYPVLVCSVDKVDSAFCGDVEVQLTEVGPKFAESVVRATKTDEFPMIKELGYTSYINWHLPTETGTVSFICEVDHGYTEHIRSMVCKEIEGAKLFLNINEAIDYRKAYFAYWKSKVAEDRKRKKSGTYTIDEIADLLGIDKSALRIIKDKEFQNYPDECYYDGMHPENYGDVEYMTND